MRILDEEIEWKENFVYSLRRYPVWWLILIITMVFDFALTVYFVEKYGAGREANHVVRFLVENLGIVTGTLIGKLLQLFAVSMFVCLHRRLGNLFLLIVILLNCWAIVMNSLI